MLNEIEIWNSHSKLFEYVTPGNNVRLQMINREETVGK